jgi:hypothetical protein
LTVGEVDFARAAVEDETEGLPFAFPFAVELFLTSRRAFAPKLIRLANGDVGTLEPEGALESSSKGLSSTEPEFALDTLSPRFRGLTKDGVGAPGMVERPRVVMDRRRWVLGDEPLVEPLARGPNMSTKEDRRLPEVCGPGGGELLFWSEDIVVDFE